MVRRKLGLGAFLAALAASGCSASNDKSASSGDVTGSGAGDEGTGTAGDGSGTATSGSGGSSNTGGSTGGAGDVSTMGGSPGTGGSPVTGAGGSAAGAGGSASMGTCGTTPMAPANAPACKNVFVATAPMIDDMEIRAPEADGPHGDTDNGMPGHWFVSADGKEGTWVPPADKWNGFYNVALAPARDTSMQAMFFGGQGFTGWGVALGVGVASCVDASSYTGVTFWAKSTSGAPLSAKFDIGTYDVVASTNGGGCTGACAGKYETTVTIPVDWKQLTIPFCAFVPSATTIPLAKDKIVNLTFLIAGKVNYQLYIDDMAFY